MNEHIKVSVVMATYQRETELHRALNSLTTQTFSEFEIVVVDDNGNEEWNNKVENIIDNFKSEYPDVQLNYIKNQINLGSAKSRNEGINNALGEYVTFLDDDDIYLPDKIKNQYTAMKEINADYSITDLELCDEDFKTTEIRSRRYIKNLQKESLLKYHLMYHLTGTDTLMFKRDYILKIGAFPLINVGDEFYLMEQAIKGEGKFVYVPVCDVKAIVHSGDIGLSGGQGKINGENRLFEHKKQYFNKLDKKTIRFIKTRHRAVLAFANLKMKKYLRFIEEGLMAFAISPINCIKLIKER